ncbi:MAG: hypothetical protein DWQ31_06820 [Planctomycetota bacterium]|nr:MAG: hypothetical protein DWQ31_06820 [Planctomycetota bacterium]REJ90315.1 MAG: hypothetical protein DWQ35_16685 [Planctomycetota bacterium]REJ95616.1 MAG: hypothetical protein DWQ35_06255 [Planctomycetota bacterium]REK25188.1 MAG: hypothetical protein DWQ42_11985 [Planctomycetota bacterium]REK40944.1 MAG: hypothetical protein DWQ46_14755 [Planctomycetota bacterium]
MESDDQYGPLIEWLRAKAHTDEEIEKILSKVRDYESRTQMDSVMDAIGDGSLDIEALVKDALGESD